MKKIIAFIIMLCVVGTSTAYANGRHYGGHAYSRDHYARSYHPRSHHNNGLGVAIGVMGGLLLGSALVSAATPPPRTVVVESPRYYPPPRICVQDQVFTGEWQFSEWDGRRVWVPYAYPVTRRVEVPCN